MPILCSKSPCGSGLGSCFVNKKNGILRDPHDLRSTNSTFRHRSHGLHLVTIRQFGHLHRFRHRLTTGLLSCRFSVHLSWSSGDRAMPSNSRGRGSPHGGAQGVPRVVAATAPEAVVIMCSYCPWGQRDRAAAGRFKANAGRPPPADGTRHGVSYGQLLSRGANVAATAPPHARRDEFGRIGTAARAYLPPFSADAHNAVTRHAS